MSKIWKNIFLFTLAIPLLLKKPEVRTIWCVSKQLFMRKTGLSMEGAKTRQQMAIEYGIHRKTFSRWLKKANIQVDGYLIAPKVQEMIYETFGDPRKKTQRVA